MKKFLYLLASALLCCSPLLADEADEEAQQMRWKNIRKLQSALQSMDYLTTAEPSAARFYMYFSAASWNKASTRVLPKLIADYEKIKKAGGEVILVNYDRTERAARKFIDDFGIGMPVFRTSTKKDDKLDLPGFKPSDTQPEVTIVDNEGGILYRGHGATYTNWNIIILNGVGLASTSTCGDGKIAVGGAVAEALRKVKYVSGAKPRNTARFYIMLCSAPWCSACTAAMPGIIKEYEAITKAGGELVLICVTGSEAEVLAYKDKYNMPFPVAAHTPRNICGAKIPNYVVASSIPEFTTLSSGGTILGTAHGAEISKWKEHTVRLP